METWFSGRSQKYFFQIFCGDKASNLFTFYCANLVAVIPLSTPWTGVYSSHCNFNCAKPSSCSHIISTTGHQVENFSGSDFDYSHSSESLAGVYDPQACPSTTTAHNSLQYCLSNLPSTVSSFTCKHLLRLPLICNAKGSLRVNQLNFFKTNCVKFAVYYQWVIHYLSQPLLIS